MPTATSTVTATSEVLTGFNIAFDTQGQKWVTRYSYIPEGMERLKNRFFSFKDGSIYVHDKGTNNTFYGTAAPSLIKIISNFNPSLVKTFDAISIEGYVQQHRPEQQLGYRRLRREGEKLLRRHSKGHSYIDNG